MINRLIERNYSNLTKVAKRIAPQHFHDLLTDTYVNVLNAKVPETDEEFVKYFSRCMSNNFRNQKSTFNKNFVIKEINCTFAYSCEGEEVDKDALLQELSEFKKQLPTHEQILFELHFELNLSYVEIAKKLTLKSGYEVSYASMFKLIKPIREKLKCKTWKSLNFWAYSRSHGYLSREQNRRNSSSLF